METKSDSSAANEGRRSGRDANEAGQDRQMVLEEARTTTNQQLAQLNKLDDETVRTVRIALVLSGLLVAGAKFLPLPNLGTLGALGTLSLVGCLVTSLFVYGTSSLFVGPMPDELSFDPEDQSNAGAAYAEVVSRYERGFSRNRRILGANGFIFGISRFLLAGAIVLFAMAFSLHFVVQPLGILYELLSIAEHNW